MNDGNIEFIWYAVRCPFCGKETLLYEKEKINSDKRCYSEEKSLLIGDMLIATDNTEKVVKLNKMKKTDTMHLCEKCEQFSKPSEEKIEITITHEEKSINIFRIIKDMKSLIDVKWNDKITFGNSFPLYEKVCFDFEKGETFISIVDNHARKAEMQI